MPLKVDPNYELWKSWIDKCREDFHRLSKWEKDFVDSVEEQLGEKGQLSERQAEILERIYSAKTK